MAKPAAGRAPRPRAAAPSSSTSTSASTAPPDDDDETTADDDAAAPAGSRAPGMPKLGTEGAGAFLALFLYPLLVNGLQGGPAQALGWVKAKWLNQPYGAAAAGGPGQGAAGVTLAPTPRGLAYPNPYITR